MGRPIDPDLPVGVWAPMTEHEYSAWLLCKCGVECLQECCTAGSITVNRAGDQVDETEAETVDDSYWHCPVCDTEVNEPAGERPYRRT